MITGWSGRHNVLLPINQNYDEIRETNKPSIDRWTILKRRYWKHSSLLNKVHRNSARKMTRTPITQAWRVLSYYNVQLQAWRVHRPINAEIGLLIANQDREFCYSFEIYYYYYYYYYYWKHGILQVELKNSLYQIR